MRVLVLAPQPFFQDRGTPIAVNALLEVMSSRGYQTTVLTYPGGEDVVLPNCTIRRVPSLAGVRTARPGLSLRKLVYDALMVPMALVAILRDHIDVVHAVEESVFIAVLGRLLLGVPYVYDMDSSLPQQLEEQYAFLRPFRSLMTRAEAFAVRRSLAVVTVCRGLADLARRYAPDTPIHCVEDFSLLAPEDRPVERLSETIGSAGPIVLYVGNLEPYQGIDLLLEAFAHIAPRLPTAHLVIIGGADTQVAAYRNRVSALCLTSRAHLLGPRPSRELAGYLAQAAVVVSPRIKGQNTPMKVYSYLDSGRPLLATRLPTHTQVLDDGIAQLAPPEPAGYGDAMATLLEDAELGSRLAAAAKERVRLEFTREAFRRKMGAFCALVEGELGVTAPKVA